jgi:hypothetical protein
MPPPQSQRGLAAAALIVAIIVVAVVLVLGQRYADSRFGLDQRSLTKANLQRVSDSLVLFASLNQRLPCPASGTLDSGLEVATTTTFASDTCTEADGVVPWSTLGLKREHALDGWGRKISYRVFSGATGFTKAGGVTMVNCNTSLGAPIDNTLDGGSNCKSGAPPPNTPSQYVGARSPMLTVSDLGISRVDNAFVLISHGETGYGAFVAELASSRMVPPAIGGRERDNTQSSATYWILARSNPEIAAGDATHFDDVVAYLGATELVTRAKLGARSWSEYSPSATFTAASVSAAAGGLFGESTGQTSLAMGGFLITGRSSSGTSEISIRTDDGVTGIGTIGGGSTAGDLNSSFGERLTFQLGEGGEFGKMDVALNAMEITDYSPLRKERAEISFWRDGNTLQTSTVEAWTPYFDSVPSRCLYRLISGSTFDRVDVAPVSQTGGGGGTRFTVAGIKACKDSTTPCTADVPGAVGCPLTVPSTYASAPTGVLVTEATLHGTVEDNGVAKGNGSGYQTSGAGYSFGNQSIELISGTGKILAGNCLTISGDGTTYIVATGTSAPGTIVLAPPGLRNSIPSFTNRTVTLVDCQSSVAFDYGLNCSVASSVTATPGSIDAGAGSTSVSATVTTLTCGTSYYVRTRATGLLGTTTSNHQQFRTGACASPRPGAETHPATLVTGTTATLHGIANDGGTMTTVTFEYGPTSCYGSVAAATPGSVTAGTGVTAVSAMIGSLTCNTWYHYRTVAVSAAGTTKGDDVTFRTTPCP